MLLFSFCSYGNHYVYPLLDWTVPSRGILTFAGVFLLYCIYCLLLYLVHKLKRFLHRLFSTVWSPQCVGLIQNNLRLSFVHLSQYLLSSMQLKVSFPVIYMQHIKLVIFCLGKRNYQGCHRSFSTPNTYWVSEFYASHFDGIFSYFRLLIFTSSQNYQSSRLLQSLYMNVCVCCRHQKGLEK